jgi:hypothetical protein
VRCVIRYPTARQESTTEGVTPNAHGGNDEMNKRRCAPKRFSAAKSQCGNQRPKVWPQRANFNANFHMRRLRCVITDVGAKA